MNHFAADFLFQTRKMGENKGKSLYWLTYHIIVYTLVLGFLSLWFFTPLMFLKWISINMVLHFFTDFTTSKLSGYFYLKADAIKREIDELQKVNDPSNETWITRKSMMMKVVHKNMKGFWSVIGFDQLIHGLCLYYTSLAFGLTL